MLEKGQATSIVRVPPKIQEGTALNAKTFSRNVLMFP